ncbi:MAG: hypothetical protein AAF488_10920 [Planctomycetota bacterium]
MSPAGNSQPEWRSRLDGVPDLACLEFVVRCARRVQPMFLAAWPAAPQRLYQLLDGAIETVEEITTGRERTTSTFAFNGMSAVKAATKAGEPRAAAVASTVTCATYALTAIGYGDLTSTHASQAAEYALEAFGGESDEEQQAHAMLAAAMSSDLEAIHAGMAAGTVGEGPVPPGLLGPLWPDDEPALGFRVTLHDCD